MSIPLQPGGNLIRKPALGIAKVSETLPKAIEGAYGVANAKYGGSDEGSEESIIANVIDTASIK